MHAPEEGDNKIMRKRCIAKKECHRLIKRCHDWMGHKGQWFIFVT